MAGERLYTRIPPESTGDRIRVGHTAIIAYDNLQGGQSFKNDEFYIVKNVGGDLEIHVHDVIQTSGTAGQIFIHYEHLDEWNGETAEDGVQIQDQNGTYIADVNGTETPLYTNVTQIVGQGNPTYGVDVDRYGSMNIRFGEGQPELSAFGQLRSSNQKILADYSFTTSGLYDQFASSLVEATPGSGQATSVHLPTMGAVKLEVQNAAATPGFLATHTSHLFHPVVTGSSTLFVLATRIGDTGKTNVLRNWGAFDANEGMFFQLDGTTLKVVHRWTLEGSTGNHSVSQENWNRDTLDGSGSGENPSGMNLDVSKINMYWIDYQHLGGGRTRWGVIYRGQRIICHEMYHNNGDIGIMTQNHNPMKNPNRPICWSVKNKDGLDPDGTENSAIYAYGAAAILEADIDPLKESALRSYNSGTLTLPASSTSTRYLYTLRPQRYYPLTGEENHSIYAPVKLEVAAYDSASANAHVETVPVELRLFQKCIMRGTSYSPISFTTVEADTDGDHIGHGPEFLRTVVDGIGTINLTTIFNTLQNGAVNNNADQTIAKQTQALGYIVSSNTEIGGSDYSSRLALPCTLIKMGTTSHPIWYNDRMYFDDKDSVIVTSIDTPGTLEDHLEGNEYYLSLVTSSTSMLYPNAALIDDDRNARIITLSANSAAFAEGHKIIFDYNSSANCEVLQIDPNDSTKIWIGKRTSSDIDTSMAAANTFTFGTTGTENTGTVSSITLSGTSAYPKDYKTNLNAISNTNIQELSGEGKIYGTPNPQAAWTFMARPLNSHPTDISLRLNMTWKERDQ